MGYTHYFRTSPSIPEDKFVKLAVATRKFLDGETDIRSECDEDAPPIISSDLIRFNGIGNDGHETFYLARESTPREWEKDKSTVFNFCKTARKPYDKYVTGVLSLAQEILGKDILVSSDGGVADWQEGINLVNKKLDKHYSSIIFDDDDD